MDELTYMYKYKNKNEQKVIYVNNIGNFLKKIEYHDDNKICEVLKRNDLLNEDNKYLYQGKNGLLNLEKTFSHYEIKTGDTIYMLPEPDPLPYLIYLFHQESGKVYSIELNHMDSIDMLHKQVERVLKIEEENQMLIYNGKCLHKKRTLKEEMLTRESLVTILDKRDIPDIQNGNEEL
ncbi:hypothetical protein PFAG_04391 [Plasmodium falciparum Santa Lucia]|uniref:Ubiquitin-like protein, putative n=9 Tax=Plasmodium falciparum TaxID=5833 RepID=Q8IEG7_PLAF7|nr:ubiquitin-like protein, putative [Plasmodium falciparum 3D7]ETW17162.1 hypothetical protein PFFVO_03989 [Plasmodium falciparum Vietnam Oak-Knoll (FVO)]ETW40916.1 hypothetical protein PFNF135_04554 [Plasmodium falciparum NF135/5.C10]ETW47708.1 hypothetical protein PFMALIP_04241 [Plasmodium falciparum MaliPS096_E11]ETW54739.1 hypothetical protein PFUGPA_03343 [Plasmodium falciparum Palo Alto/Uganda]ETW59897.1 hypothetical protein PFMC_04357 [Plasmodium falciparum CAMP/Malaysia]EUT81174.1 hyp|eukprot:XP_001349884.1 ubiquitin-like protein, putative [Plasmodium falciparum 3D7]